MRVAPQFARFRGPISVVALLVAVTACGGSSEPMSSPGDKPDETSAAPKQVDVCRLLRPSDIRETLGASLGKVSLEYGAAQVPTLACGLGTEFGVPQVTVQLATGPISTNVFEDAYGHSAGGDPESIDKLGTLAFFRNEPDSMEVRALVNGAILTLEVANDPAVPVEQKTVVDLARQTAKRLPANPRLAPTPTTSPCSGVSGKSITAAIGTAASVASSLADDDGSMMCSWASRPGSVVISILRSPERIASYRRLMDENLYTTVDEVKASGDLEAVSRTDKAGDLLIFDADRAMAVIALVPTAGFSDATVLTTPGEIQLANDVVDSLL